jgi:hemolysin III
MSSPSDLLEERWNVITHGLGIALALLGIPFLVYTALTKGDPAHVWAVSIFAASVLLMYAVSTTYHSVRHPEHKRWFQILDHISIYYLIAGSYTPFLVFFVDEPARSSYLLLMWALPWWVPSSSSFSPAALPSFPRRFIWPWAGWSSSSGSPSYRV